MEPYDFAEMGLLYDHVPLYVDREDVAFYVEESRRAGGEVLELGCGTGRVLLPAARAGARITGLDRSAAMLDRCGEKLAREPEEVRGRARLVSGDMRDFDLGRSFALVTIPFRPFQHLVEVEDQLACLRSIRRHLGPGGRLVFDVFNPDPARLAHPSDEEHEDTPMTDLPDGRCFRRTTRVLAVHWTRQVSDVQLTYHLQDPGGVTRQVAQRFPMRWYLRFELEHLLARSGFRVAELYGGFDRRPLEDGAPDQVFVATVAAQGPAGVPTG